MSQTRLFGTGIFTYIGLRVGGLYGPPFKGHLGVCAIYSETTVYIHWSGFNVLVLLYQPLRPPGSSVGGPGA